MIKRNIYLNKLIKKQWNDRIKVITGIRRCGKSTILFKLFKQYLMQSGVPNDHIIEIALDTPQQQELRNTNVLYKYITSRVANSNQKFYVFIDEVQYAISKQELRNQTEYISLYSVFNGLLRENNIDVYVTGSNSKLLSKDIATEFRGRGDVIKVYPLSFKEYFSQYDGTKEEAYDDYFLYGGMPYITQLSELDEKKDYLDLLFEEIYFKDIEERYAINFPEILKELTNIICSSIGSMVSTNKLSRTIKSIKNINVDSNTIGRYIQHLQDSFLISEAVRYDVKGKKYFEYPTKLYCTDIGLRNSRLGFRQQEETHIMENLIYNELLIRGYAVDVGVIALNEKDDNKVIHRKNCEIDFIARKGSKIYYIQSALSMDDEYKEKTELRPLTSVRDSFKKIVISKSYGHSWFDNQGILRINLLDFLLDENSLDR